MNNLIEVKREFEEGSINKWNYIDKMYNFHNNLFDYAEFMTKTNISSIEIIDNGVIMTFRDSKLRFICRKNDKRTAPLDTLNFGDYEKEEFELQLNLIKPNDTVLDIGGNHGWYAMNVAINRPTAQIFSFEPIPLTYAYLNENIKLNDLNNISTFNFGFSDSEGSFKFFFDPTLSVNASLVNVSENNDTENITCIVKKLDSLINLKKNHVDFIKCDVEGAELFVFKGGIDLIKRDCPIIFTEMLRKWTAKFNYHPNDIITFLHNLGYSCFIANKNNLMQLNIVDENTKETNYFFLHKEKHADQINTLSNK